MNQNIFVVSGLGADQSVFVNLKLPNYNLIHIHWIDPIKNESMADYAKRLLPQITENNPILLGLSLGGMIVLEMGKLIPTKMIISLSSIINVNELPWLYRFGGKLRLQKILPIYTFTKSNRFAHLFFGVYTKEDKLILNGVMKRLDRRFLYWALNAVLTWNNENIIPNLYRIHGNRDRVLPFRKQVNYDQVIEGGSHLMLLDKSESVSDAILKILKL